MNGINTLRKPSAPHLNWSSLAHALHLDSSNPTQESFLRRNKVPIAGLALTALLLAACAADPSSIPAAPVVDTWREVVLKNPYHYPQITAAVAGTIAGVSSGIVSGVEHVRNARDPNRHNYNWLNAGADTIFDGVSNGLAGAYVFGMGALLYELGISKEILDRVVSQLPALGGLGIAIGTLNSAQKIQDVLQLIFKIPGVLRRRLAAPTATPPVEATAEEV